MGPITPWVSPSAMSIGRENLGDDRDRPGPPPIAAFGLGQDTQVDSIEVGFAMRASLASRSDDKFNSISSFAGGLRSVNSPACPADRVGALVANNARALIERRFIRDRAAGRVARPLQLNVPCRACVR